MIVLNVELWNMRKKQFFLIIVSLFKKIVNVDEIILKIAEDITAT